MLEYEIKHEPPAKPFLPADFWAKGFSSCPASSCLDGINMRRPTRACVPHSHRHAIEICFLERGEQTYRVGGLLHRLRGNDQFFTLPGEVHDTANLPQERGILYWLILKLEPSKNILGLSEPRPRCSSANCAGCPRVIFAPIRTARGSWGKSTTYCWKGRNAGAGCFLTASFVSSRFCCNISR